ncbi:hypothetical protein GCM10007079_02120 [Nocardiopsis terrae]|uniref:Serine/threonine protein kinase n=1 Tax=Nocardiopsis terrae TaxID=372655 RepID=A0ABR9HML8_9ACTN|nr:serine/threonine-protein kinase [Nocardiopsis terrae]MBE1460265.1 serine/threonine protein kinase [Nocardiopsis terrae]GHC70545.1 hypothetical protein GCM10007079_02120 [Nocardiopsis terrae]
MPAPPQAARRNLGLSPLTSGDPVRVGGHTLVGRLGAGGLGTVYAALGHDSQLFAIRVFRPGCTADPGFRARLREEVDLVRRVDSPYIPRFVTAAPEADPPWTATELVPGPTLGEWVAGSGPLTGEALLAVAAGTLEALCALHTRGLVHRNLGPDNVKLAPTGPKVLDPGIVRALDEAVLARTGGLAGAPGRTAPERYRRGGSGPGVDVFAWGVLLAFAATGREPFGEGAPQEVARRVLWEEPDLAGVPEDLLPLVEAALEKDPDLRPRSPELLRGLTADGAQTAELVRLGWLRLARPRGRGRRRALAAVTGALLAAWAVGALLFPGAAAW